jgi:hypothetical protein
LNVHFSLCILNYSQAYRIRKDAVKVALPLSHTPF